MSDWDDEIKKAEAAQEKAIARTANKADGALMHALLTLVVRREGLPWQYRPVPPHDLDDEAHILAAMLLDEQHAKTAIRHLGPDDFYSNAHAVIFGACKSVAEAGQPIDIVQVGSWLKSDNKIAHVGGMAYLTELLNAAPGGDNEGRGKVLVDAIASVLDHRALREMLKHLPVFQ